MLTLALSNPIVHAQFSSEDATLLGSNENPPLFSDGFGSFSLQIPPAGDLLFSMFYISVPTPVTMAHIHLGNPGTNGPVVVTLCGTPDRACPESGTPLVATIAASEVQAVMDGDRVLLAAGDRAGFIDLIFGGATYVNVHTEAHPTGELRGQINERER